MKGKLEELTIEELDRTLRENREELRKERFKAVTSKLDNPKKIQELKKNIARILTLKNEYKLGIRSSRV
ncbi:MAG TPA: 50S ribosomal protein L29 [Spirochaetota bacterium]|nr:50S ribosomal protein L29 [Spirochaetota bacterium]HPJ36853.1 50S ribosomal protein L29 [Spirochaetota bacterium]HPQ51790.1 50S ribosomal protein L29 [Spirochaetota bacterium]